MRVSVNIIQKNGSAVKTCQAMAKGIKRSGDIVVVRSDRESNMDGFDACVLWGFITSCQNVIRQCVAKSIPYVFLDMGYWRRDLGHYKVAVNDRHPTKYVMDLAMPEDRFRSLGIPIQPYHRRDGSILLAGMSGKASWSYGLDNEFYERRTVQDLQRITKRAIVYRPKPSWPDARPIPGTIYDRNTPLPRALASAHCVVSHHSNVGADSLLAGVPIFQAYGAASVLALQDLNFVERPRYPTDMERERFAANLAYCQWTTDEMASGKCWDYLKKSGLLK